MAELGDKPHARDLGKVSPQALEAAHRLVEVVAAQGDDLDDVLIEIASDDKYQQSLSYGVEGFDKLGQERFLQWIALGRTVEGIRNYFQGRVGMGIKLVDEPERNKLVRPLVERIYEIAAESYGSVPWPPS
jgi:hypothetical protein